MRKIFFLLMSWALAVQANPDALASKINESLLKTHNKVESDRSQVELFNQNAEPLNQGAQFQGQQPNYGVDMRLAQPLPDFEFEASKNPSSWDTKVESELQERQTTDYLVEESWLDIRRSLQAR
jgi:hypothetical protein